MQSRVMCRFKGILSLSFFLLLVILTKYSEAVPIGWVKVVDNGDPGYQETGIAWVSYPFPEAHNGEYRYLSHLGHKVERKGTATWKIQIPTTGSYSLEIHYRPTENRTNDADFHVYDGNGKIHKYSINQSYHGHLSSTGWLNLGTFKWYSGQMAKIVLDGTDDNQSDEADAVRWKLVSSNQIAMPGVQKLLFGNQSEYQLKVNLKGVWTEVGGYQGCPNNTSLTTEFSYDSNNYNVSKSGNVENEDCSVDNLSNWSQSLSQSDQLVTKDVFKQLIGEIFPSSTINITSFLTDTIEFEVDHPTKGVQNRLLTRNITKVNLEGTWTESGDFTGCLPDFTNFLTIYNYSGGRYEIIRNGLLVYHNCSTETLVGYTHEFSPTNALLTEGDFISMVSEIITDATVTVLEFASNRIVYKVEHQVYGTETFTLEKQ